MTARDATPAAALRIEIRKHADGSALLRCIRADGTATWQHQRGHQARFFPLHDLTHYALETTLGASDGFFGLIAQGWDIGDTGGKGERGKLPAQAVYVEHLVGLVERGGIGRAPLTAAEVNAELRTLHSRGEVAYAPPVTDDQLERARAAAAALHDQWAALDAGSSLALEFPAA